MIEESGLIMRSLTASGSDLIINNCHTQFGDDPLSLFSDSNSISDISDYNLEDSCMRNGPTVSQCIIELESLKYKALDDIKDLTDHREALEYAKILEGRRKQTKHVRKFLETDYTLTVQMLNLRTRYLSIKFAFLNGMIEKLRNFELSAISPTYLRKRSFDDWLKHSDIIDVIQEELLGARTKKVRLKRKFLANYFKEENPFLEMYSEHEVDFDSLKTISLRVRGATNEMTFMKDDIDNIQRQLTQILRESESRKNKVFDVLGSLLNDPHSFENRKINEYIKECHDYPPGDPEDEWTSILVFEDNCTEPYSESIPGANPSRYQEYVKALSMYICDKLKAATVPAEPAAVFATLEQKLLPKIYFLATRTIQKPQLDTVLFEKCRIIKGYTQQQIGIPKQFISSDLLPYYSSITRFKSLVFSMTPTKIMQAISLAAKDIHAHMVKVCPNTAIGADAFLPIWVYCIIKANIPKLATLVNFLKGYLNPDLRYCEIGYYVTCLEGACAYIKELKEDHQYADTKYLIFDKTKYKNLDYEKQLFNYLEDYTLTGYKLHCHNQLLTKEHKIYKCALEYTANASDTVECGIVSMGQNMTNVQVEHLNKLLTTDHHSMIKIGDNLITVAVKTLSDSNWLPVASGDFTPLLPHLQLVISLHRMNILTDAETSDLLNKLCIGDIYRIPDSIYSRIAIKYGFYLKDEDKVRGFICEVQLLLQHLDYLSVFVKIDGVMNELTVTAVRSFQKKQNESGEYRDKLPESGIFCKDTYNRLRDALKEVLCNLKTLDYRINFNPLSKSNIERTRNFISKVQTELRVKSIISGNFSKETVAAIGRAVYEYQVASWCTSTLTASRDIC